MSLARELGADESEVASWPSSRIARWLAFFDLENEEREQHMAEQRVAQNATAARKQGARTR